jgi:aryl-alcohol dehydrogenase-like predicted oxidoreductase
MSRSRIAPSTPAAPPRYDVHMSLAHYVTMGHSGPTPIDETMRALDTLVEQGKLRYLGFGVTPWGPLRCGALSGKYKRADKSRHEAGRGARVTSYLDDRTFDLLDLMARSQRS